MVVEETTDLARQSILIKKINKKTSSIVFDDFPNWLCITSDNRTAGTHSL
ncbi:hypothetical protein Syncc8109_0103 [Synechococcus sp. WH 8109]|nr:hypothetical protein Syncc8109_0103 [Synechococcus sp. WH 8109]